MRGILLCARAAYVLAVLILLPAWLARADEPAPAAAEQPPVIPGLVVGATPAQPKSFVVDGVLRSNAGAGMLFRLAQDDTRQLTVLSDLRDGTPIMLSDGRQTIVYDIAGDQLVLVPFSRAYVQVDWDRKDEKPLKFNMGMDTASSPDAKSITDPGSWVRIDHFVEAVGAELKRLDSPADVALFGRDRGTSIESLQTRPGDPKSFHFTSLKRGNTFYTMDVRASHIDQPVPAATLAFPDVERLGKELKVTRAEPGFVSQTASLLRNGRAWVIKLALGGNADDLAAVEKLLASKPDWDELRKRDARLGAEYRRALERQGVQLPSAQPNEPAPDSKP